METQVNTKAQISSRNGPNSSPQGSAPAQCSTIISSPSSSTSSGTLVNGSSTCSKSHDSTVPDTISSLIGSTSSGTLVNDSSSESHDSSILDTISNSQGAYDLPLLPSVSPPHSQRDPPQGTLSLPPVPPD